MPISPVLRDVLQRAQALGLLGPVAIEHHVRHADAFRQGLPREPATVLDLGSGGGIPGLILATTVATSRWVLLDARQRCARFLEGAIADLDLESRVSVVRSRAEEAGRRVELRAVFDAVVARAFGPPAVTAECGSPFLRLDGVLLVSLPPGTASANWPAEGLAPLGLTAERIVGGAAGRVQVLRQVELCPSRFPRRVGISAKRPLFSSGDEAGRASSADA